MPTRAQVSRRYPTTYTAPLQFPDDLKGGRPIFPDVTNKQEAIGCRHRVRIWSIAPVWIMGLAGIPAWM